MKDRFLEAVKITGAERAIFENPEIAHLMAVSNRILSARTVEGLEFRADETEDGISAVVVLKRGVKLPHPVHICFGVLQRRGLQNIKMDVTLEPDSKASFIAHCVFPEAEKVRHIMDARITVMDGADMHYREVHFHGFKGGAYVNPRALVQIMPAGSYITEFTLTHGRVGELEIDYDVESDREAMVEMIARVFGHGMDRIKVKERVCLKGAGARSLIKTRIALEDNAHAEVTGITEGHAPGARGHVDCMEIVKDRAEASAVPIVNVTHPEAKVTHEAAIGSVDRQQMETLMARGLTPEEAVEVIVEGILR